MTIRERSILLFLWALGLTLCYGGESSPPVAPSPVPEGFTFAAVGDIIYVQPMLNFLERRSPDILRTLRAADVTFGNFEATAIDLPTFKGYPEAESGGAWIFATKEVPGELKAMGFDLLSTANNHALDWGALGMNESMERLAQAGLVTAGTGQSLSAARSPRYATVGSGRVALVAATSTFPPMARAADGLGTIHARPGVNALRIENEGGKGGKPERLNERDERETLRSIKAGRLNSEFLIFSLHTHEPSDRATEPAPFAVALARSAIDGGADAIVMHGCHKLRGIEIYHGRPIFYSLGNFFFMLNDLDQVPAELFENFGVEPTSTSAVEFMHRRNQAVHFQTEKYVSVIAVGRFEHGALAMIELHPIELGLGTRGLDLGAPRTPSPESARTILETLAALSLPMGTKIEIRDGIGFVNLGESYGVMTGLLTKRS